MDTCLRRYDRSIFFSVSSVAKQKNIFNLLVYVKKFFTCLLAWGLFFIAFQVLAVSPGKNSLDIFLEDLDTFSADFEQSLIGASGEILETTRGAVQLRRPGMFSWLYREPYIQKIISDGATLWIYEEDLEQVTISDASVAIEDTPALIFSGDFSIAEHYVVVELESEDDLAWLELTPRDLEAQYRSLRLAFSNTELRGMVLFDSLGQTLLITFANAIRNPELKREYFRFSPADGVDIIDARQNADR